MDKQTGDKKKRLTKTERAIATAERLARLLIAAPAETDGPLAPPVFITDQRLAPALQFWKDHAGQFVKLGTLEQPDRFAFAMLCVYVGEFIAAQDDILARGYSVNVKTIAGGFMPRESPSVGRRDWAAKMILDLSRSFGLTKLDRLNLSRLERGNATAPSLFPDDRDRRGRPSDDVPTSASSEVTDPEVQTLRDLLAPRTVN
jgi:phage terminase small subunit